MPRPPVHALSIPAHPALAPWPERLAALAVASLCLAVLLTAAWLTPSAEGAGTHQQLGLPPCGFLTATGLPCATCGMTTSFSLAAHGRFVESFNNQPAGAILALLTACVVIVAGYAAASGARLGPLLRALWRPATIWTAGGLLIASWLYKAGLMWSFST